MIDANSNQPEVRRSGFQVGMSHLFARSIQGMAGIGTLFALGASPAHAAAAGAPWEAPLQTFLNSLTGPVAQIVGVAAIVLCGFAIAFSEGGGGIRKLVWVALGLSIAYSAAAFFLPLFGFAGGVAF